jgi:hypothetical protein
MARSKSINIEAGVYHIDDLCFDIKRKRIRFISASFGSIGLLTLVLLLAIFLRLPNII